MTQINAHVFHELTGVYEPSAIQQLPDGRFLVVEDEKQYPFSLVTISQDGRVVSTPLNPGPLESGDAFLKLDDLEGVTIDHAGYIYAITSHSLNDEGEEKKSRNKLVRFRVEGDHIVAPEVVQGLKATLVARHPVLATAAKVIDVKKDGGLNMEALEFSPDQQRLLIGFRSPLVDSMAIIASVENPSAIFETCASPIISDRLETLNLDGHGIRGMSYFPSLDGYLVISGPVAREQVQFQLWFWSGHRNESVCRVTVPGLSGFERAEGVCPAVIDGRQKMIIVSDDGSRDEARYARFLLLEPEQLQIDAAG